ncbi:YT521-B-like domain-containing protein [Xylariales sp. AK1849]|nr:YT521-B-like domain-containing protein [Xylariales sp. AK1849]
MGDAPPPSSSPNEYSGHETFKSPYHGSAPSGSLASFAQGSSANPVVFQPQYQSQFDPSQNAFSAQFDMTQPQDNGRGGPQGPYNMTAMANALPPNGYRPGFNNNGQHRYNAGGPSPGVVQHMAAYAGQSNMNPLAGQQYYMAQHTQIPPYYNNHLQASQPQAGLSSRHNMSYYPNQVMMNSAQQQLHGGYYYPQQSHYTTQAPPMQGHMMSNQYIPSDPRGPSPGGAQDQSGSVAYGPSEASFETRASSSVVRGPPRKPRQSGHAIWIGNLPPQTDLMSLVHHVCGEASGLESLFLISKSNCAFANFKDEQSCVRAQQKLHDSKFQSVRLVSRLRKSTVEGTSGQTAPTGPAATSPSVQAVAPGSIDGLQSASTDAPEQPTPTPEDQTDQNNIPSGDAIQQKDKFFILKSLTVEDLELSMRNGVWATQSHNEETLNSAFEAADNIYLVFSANKSGEYFGYARMVSPINNDPAAAIEFAPKAQTTADPDLPKAIPTDATDNCPRGNIIDDSARGTIFWEIERDEAATPTPTETDSEDSSSPRSGHEGEGNSKAWGKPFKLEWLSTTRLPFYRTRGLRNPWNSNREVKIARDGTELEPSVGRRLIGLFNRVQSPAPMSMGMRQGMAVVAGYPPPMRQPYPAQQ